MSLQLITHHHHDEATARAHFEALRWGDDGRACPHCDGAHATRLDGAKHRAGLYQCKACRRQFTVTVGTRLEGSKVPLHKWLQAVSLLVSARGAITAQEMSERVGVAYRTGWAMRRRIFEAYLEAAGRPLRR